MDSHAMLFSFSSLLFPQCIRGICAFAAETLGREHCANEPSIDEERESNVTSYYNYITYGVLSFSP
jgi:hypothetical protein